MRSGYIKKAIDSGACLLASLVNEEVENIILGRVAWMVERCWTMEYKAYNNIDSKEHKRALINDFWSKVAAGPSEVDSSVYSIEIIHNETVNPPGKEGCVYIRFQVSNSVKYYCFKIDPINGDAAQLT